MSQFVFILDWDWLVIAFQKAFLRFWNLYLVLSQLVCPLLSEGVMMRYGFVAQLDFFQGRVIDAKEVRFVDVGLGILRYLKSPGDPERTCDVYFADHFDSFWYL